MPFLLDTNVVSEPGTKRPEQRVVDWIETTPTEQMYLSVLTIGEIEQGIAHLEANRERTRAKKLRAWLEGELLATFEGRVLPLDLATLRVWGEVTGAALAKGRPTPLLDSLLAATALQHHLTLVTRNTPDVEGLGVEVFNPWE